MKLNIFNQWQFESREEAEDEIKKLVRLEKGDQIMLAISQEEGGKDGEWVYGTFLGLSEEEGNPIVFVVDEDNIISTVVCSWDYIAMPRASSGE